MKTAGLLTKDYADYEVREVGKATRLLDRTLACHAPTIIHVGGAGSSKSHTLAQLMIGLLTEKKNKRIGVCRKTLVSLRMTAMDLIIHLLQEYGIYDRTCHSKSENYYKHYNGSMIQFFGLDEPEKIKSTNFNYVWMEEANEFTYDDYKTLQLRMRSPTTKDEPNQMFLSLNPVDANIWIASRLIHESGVETIHSTYKDNDFLDENYTKTLENLINEDENYYRVYCLGEWGHLENLIYRDYKIVDDLPEEREAMAYGLDFGWVNPSVIVKVIMSKGQVYLDEIFYKSEKTTKDIIEFFSHQEKGDIYGDPSAKQMVAEIHQAGFNAVEAIKDVKAGIDICKRQTLNITKRSDNLIKEIQGYQYKKDKNGVLLEEPVKFNDHAVDAFRYAIYGLVTRFGYATASPSGRVTAVHRR